MFRTIVFADGKGFAAQLARAEDDPGLYLFWRQRQHPDGWDMGGEVVFRPADYGLDPRDTDAAYDLGSRLLDEQERRTPPPFSMDSAVELEA